MLIAHAERTYQSAAIKRTNQRAANGERILIAHTDFFFKRRKYVENLQISLSNFS